MGGCFSSSQQAVDQDSLCAHTESGAGLGFEPSTGEFRAADVSRTIEKVLRREFINRLDEVVVFRPLSREAMRSILLKELRDVQTRRGMRNRNWEVVWEESATEFLLEQGFSPDLGARPLKRAVERHLLNPLAETIVQQRFPEGDLFLYIHAGGGKLNVEFIDPHAPEEAGEEPPAATDAPELMPEPGPGLAPTALAPRGTSAEHQQLEAWLKEREFRPEIMVVSGYAAYAILKSETGLHVWEEPSSRADRYLDHRPVLVQVVRQPASGADANLSQARQALHEAAGQTPAIVRHYREAPSPLVKDRNCGWRTGKLEQVLAGNFDLLNSLSRPPAARRSASWPGIDYL